jgi:hypothetical protein
MSCFLDPTGIDRVSSVSFRAPNGTTRSLVGEGDPSQGIDSFDFQEPFATQGALDATYPNGDYTLTINAVNDGTKVVTINLSGNVYPAAPHISNFDAAQAIEPLADFVLHWDPLNGAANDFVQVRIEDSSGNKIAGSGNSPGDPGSLNGTATSFTIPKGALSPGHTYAASLFIAHGTSENTTYAYGLGAYLAETSFAVKAAGTLVRPTLGKLVLLPDGRLQFELAGVPGNTYVIEASTGLNGDWGAVQTVTLPSTSSASLVVMGQNGPHQFFRAREI